MEKKFFDKKKCMSTIYAIAKEKGIKIGDLEKEANVSAGYFSKLNKEDNTATPSVELLVAVSNVLGVTVDLLIDSEYEGINTNEKYILNFIDKLIQHTESGYLNWKKETKKELLNVGYTGDGNCLYAMHPLFEVGEVSEIGPSGYPESSHMETYYNSRFYQDGETKIAGCGYHTALTKDADIYVMKVDNEEAHAGIEYDQYEIYIIKKGNVEPLCCNEFVCTSIATQIDKLYTTISELEANLGINDIVKSVIDAFMDDLPFE